MPTTTEHKHLAFCRDHWMTEGLRRFFRCELSNEESMRRESISKEGRFAMPPASNLNTAIDSLSQVLGMEEDIFGLKPADISSLLYIRNLMPKSTLLVDLLGEEG